MFSVVFVCTGNICRSPMAQALLDRRLRELGRQVTVTSMGVHGLDNEPASPFAVQVCGEDGLDISEHRSRPLVPAELEAADLIFAFEMVQKDFVALFFPQTVDRVFMLGCWPADDSGRGAVRDPMGQSLRVYRGVYAMIKKHIGRISPIVAGLIQ